MDSEERLKNAIATVKDGRYSARKASEIYGVSRSTLLRRMNGVECRKRARHSNHRLSVSNEAALIEHIKELDDNGFIPTTTAVRDAAIFFSVLPSPVGQHFAKRFLAKQPELQARISRSHDYQKALREDPAKVSEWFSRYRDVKAKYEISDINVYNMDEIKFQIEMSYSQQMLEPCYREWATSIVCIGAGGHTVPPFLIVKGTDYLESSYVDSDLSDGWMISATTTGVADNSTALAWLEHFDKHTVERACGQNRMLMLDSHESHMSVAFRDYCKVHKIILVCLPSKSSPILQPLRAGFFSVLKRAYYARVNALARKSIRITSKAEFFQTFHKAYVRAIAESNVGKYFESTGLIPCRPDLAISTMHERPSDRETLPPDSETLETGQSKVPRNLTEFRAQCALIERKLQDPRSWEAFQRVVGYIEAECKELELLQSQVCSLKAANAEGSRGKIGLGAAIMTVEEIRTAMAKERRPQATSSARKTRNCGECAKSGHNRQTRPIPQRRSDTADDQASHNADVPNDGDHDEVEYDGTERYDEYDGSEEEYDDGDNADEEYDDSEHYAGDETMINEASKSEPRLRSKCVSFEADVICTE